MNKRYVVLGSWIDKQSGAPRSSLAEINEGKNKDGKNYQITKTDSTLMIDGTYAVGTILGGVMTLTPEVSPAQATGFGTPPTVKK